jgi:hypothetical protein
MAFDFTLNKPVGVDLENMEKVVNDIYDAINRLSKATNSYVSQSKEEVPSPKTSSPTQVIKVVEEDDVKIKVQVDGEWYYTVALEKET